MATNIRSGASDGALQLNGVDIVTFNSTGITGGLINASSAEVAARTNSTKAITPLGLQSLLVSGTAQNTTSGTSIDFTGIPSWAKRITVMFNGVSTSGTSSILVQIGAGSVTTSGYLGGSTNISSAVTTAQYTTGFGIRGYDTATFLMNGSISIKLISGFIYIADGVLANTVGNVTSVTAGNVTLTGVLDRIRLTTTSGTDLFDAGSVNIMWE